MLAPPGERRASGGPAGILNDLRGNVIGEPGPIGKPDILVGQVHIGPIGVSRVMRGGWFLDIAVPLPQARRHGMDDQQVRALPPLWPDFDGDHL